MHGKNEQQVPANWRPQKGILHKGVDHFSTKGGKKTPLAATQTLTPVARLFAPALLRGTESSFGAWAPSAHAEDFPDGCLKSPRKPTMNLGFSHLGRPFEWQQKGLRLLVEPIHSGSEFTLHLLSCFSFTGLGSGDFRHPQLCPKWTTLPAIPKPTSILFPSGGK